MKSFRLIMLPLLAALMLAGCKHRDDEVVGKWKNPLGTIYSFFGDKTFTRTSKGGSASGTWSVTGDKVTTIVSKVNNESYKDKTIKSFKDAKSLLPPDFVENHSKAEFLLNADGHTMTHKNTTTGRDVPYTKL